MHLLILTSEFPPDLGGIATYLEHSARMLTRAGHHVTIIAPGDARVEAEVDFGAVESAFLRHGGGYHMSRLSRWVG